MRVMKDSGIEWIGEIPTSWELKRLRFFANFNPATELPEYLDTDIVSFIPMDHLKAGFHNTASVEFQKVKNGYVTFQDNDILMAKVTPCLENGNLAIAKDLIDGFGFGSTEINVIRCNDINRQYLFYLLQCPGFIEKATYSMFGVAGLKRLEPRFIPDALFPIPTIEEQQIIVTFLNSKCAEIDALIAAKEKTNALLKAHRQSIIYEAVTKGLDPTAPMKDSGVDWIGEIPENWGKRKAKRIGKFKSGDRIATENIRDKDKYPVYGGNGVRGYTDSLTHEGEFVLIGRQGALCGNVHLVKGAFWASEHAVVGDISSDIDIRYAYYALTAKNLNRLSVTAAQPGLSVDQIENVILPIPSCFAEQREICDYLDNACKETDVTLSLNESIIKKLKDYRQSLIYEAVTGKIEV